MVDLVSGFGGAIVDVVAPETGEPLRAVVARCARATSRSCRSSRPSGGRPRDTDDRDELRGLAAFADVRANDAVLRARAR